MVPFRVMMSPSFPFVQLRQLGADNAALTVPEKCRLLVLWEYKFRIEIEIALGSTA